ncbi:DUF6446 family protein [Shimia thalassica]|uniref:DUF6446 family protein n=1 Tax=Shimia thalassica TaxID=1715693 RepID=UPI001C09804E|nr:DUF6446 family protein [Shimia thalassica]MBU2943107.1 histidine kinase [Shimia thalassica]MDO6479028.1 DUF6446 family protein [Shimia thalassica]MDO6502570.1 DUF6446 family protein [Shimia thalassica]MDP2519202.1 DUF6446 family protein [Shimia thalassica]
MLGKIIAGAIVITGLAAGVAMYYLQVYHYYETIEATGTNDVEMTLLVTEQPEPILYDSFEAINATSSPIRYRACFTTTQSLTMMTETYVAFETPEPLVAPNWFSCFDAEEIGYALERGEALAFMGTENIEYGIDRVVAVFPDGRGYVWHQINHCGEKVFNGEPTPEGCPPKPGY